MIRIQHLRMEYGDTVALENMIDQIGRDNLEINFNPTTFVHYGNDAASALEHLYERICYVRLADAVVSPFGPRAPFEGEVAQAVLEKLLAREFLGTVSMDFPLSFGLDAAALSERVFREMAEIRRRY